MKRKPWVSGVIVHNVVPPPPCPTNNFVLKKYGPNGSVRWTRRSVPATILRIGGNTSLGTRHPAYSKSTAPIVSGHFDIPSPEYCISGGRSRKLQSFLNGSRLTIGKATNTSKRGGGGALRLLMGPRDMLYHKAMEASKSHFSE